MPEATVVVVTRNRPAETERCISSIIRQRPQPPVILLDNASDPDHRPTAPPGVRALHCGRPLGVAAARNFALGHVESPVVVLLDDDAEFQDTDAVRRILDVFKASSRVALLALNCLATRPQGPPLEQMRLVGGLRDATPRLTVGQQRAVPSAEFIGAGCAFRMEIFRSLGGFREDFMYGYEEFHLSLRLLEAGWDILYLPEVRVLHHHATTWRLTDEARLSSQLRNKWTMAAELVPVPWIPGAVLPLTARTLCSLRRSGQPGATGRILGMAMRGFRTGWGAGRPVSVRTVRRVLALRGRL